MSTLNKAIIIGRLGKDPDLRSTQSNKQVCNFSVATSEKYKDASGASKENTEWHNVVVWGKAAENCSKYLSKGSLALVEGQLRTREWEDKEGKKNRTTEINAFNVQFLDSKPQHIKQKESQPEPEHGPDNPDDTLPF